MRATTRVYGHGSFDQRKPPGSTNTISEPANAAPSDATGGDQSDHSESINSRINWHELVARIQCGDNSGLEDLYALFARGIQYAAEDRVATAAKRVANHETRSAADRANRRPVSGNPASRAAPSKYHYSPQGEARSVP